MLETDTSTHVPLRGVVSTTPADFAAASWLAGYANQNTRDSYATQLRGWFYFCADHNLDPVNGKR